ncbi:MAG TPA: phosphatidate cytidylyltransferase [Gaiellaceae bacterium]|nr:phosphatidate cytidylyltransferase [Gaiellaceae bacterium]
MNREISRVVVAAMGAPVVLGLVWLGGWWIVALAAVAGVTAIHEFWLLVKPLRPLALAGYGSLAGILLGAKLGGASWMVGGFLAVFALAFLFQLVSRTRAPATVAIGATVLGAAWIGLGLGALLLLRELPRHGRLAVFALLLAVWAADTLAYLVGRAIGRHRLAPILSPGKTWEGFFAGLVTAVFVVFIALYHQHFLTIGDSVVLGLAIAVSEAAGDLFESMLKRDMQVKDTGRLLAGHGGMLDRIDALLFAAPAAYWTILALTG